MKTRIKTALIREIRAYKKMDAFYRHTHSFL